MTIAATFWLKHKMASTSLVFSILEIIIVWSAVAVAPPTGQRTALLRLISTAWIVGSVGAIMSAVVAIIVDHCRGISLFALLVAMATFLICGLPMLV